MTEQTTGRSPRGRVRREAAQAGALGALLALSLVAAMAAAGCGRSKTPNVRDRIDRADIPMLMTAAEKFNKDCGRYPTAAEGVEALFNKPAAPDIAARWQGPYLNNPDELKDPFGHVYKLATGERVIPNTNQKVLWIRFWSVGKDGQSGTDDDYPPQPTDAGLRRPRP